MESRAPKCAHKLCSNPWLTLNCICSGEVPRGSTESDSWKIERFKQSFQLLPTEKETELRVSVLPS